ncbi:hypothetical protein CRE_06195 [Caenorhabditis remanei]|uniref:Uncharacterized protein n=1 Tax=Caenorhabditis remanei TaxID=31234 RepID=E3NLV6_CAERE|nr:hypothetical protein CRE_06195 [Caenorhabditis remanei]
MDNIRGKLPFRRKSCRSAGYSFKAVVKRLRETSIRGMSNIHESTSRPADDAMRSYTIPHRIVTSRGSKFNRFRLHHHYRWIHQCEPRKPHCLKEFEGRSRNEPMLYDQSTTGHRELMDKLKASEAKISLVPTPVTHDPRLHCSLQSNDSSRIQHPVQLHHYVEHTSPEVTSK